MSILWSVDSEYARERCRWETTHTQFGPPGRAAVYQEFPLMVYRAKRAETGGKPILEHHIVNDEQEERNLLSRGFVRGPEQAIARLEYGEQELARAAAERAYAEQRMSDRAKQEAAKVDESTIQHLGEIPEQSIKHRTTPKLTPEERAAIGARLAAGRAKAKKESA